MLSGNANVKSGDLTVCGLTTTTDLNGLTVRRVLGVVNTAPSILALDSLTTQHNGSFGLGTSSTFAQQRLVNGACH